MEKFFPHYDKKPKPADEAAAAVKQPKFYPADNVNKPFANKRKSKPTKLRVSMEKFDDKYFAKQIEKKRKNGEGEFFEAEKEEKNVLPQEKKDGQKALDAQLVKPIEGVPDLKAYLAAQFSVKSNMKPHELVF